MMTLYHLRKLNGCDPNVCSNSSVSLTTKWHTKVLISPSLVHASFLPFKNAATFKLCAGGQMKNPLAWRLYAEGL